MTPILWALVAVAAVGLAYTLQFTSATLSFGRELSETDSATGFQDAITPPWQTNLALFVYVAAVAIVIAMWWQAGWLSALGAAVGILVGSSLVKLVLPKPSDPHYKKLIVQSMCSRYADYMRDGDVMRAEAMEHLLVKAGIDPDAFRRA